MAAGIVKKIRNALDAVNRQIRGYISSSDGNYVARGLSGEGYDGGYRDALHDVIQALNGSTPDRWLRWKDLHDDLNKESK